MTATIGVSAIVAFVVASLVYVYAFRGETRFAGLREYLRKGWPVFGPINSLLYLFTEKRARKPYSDLADFPELAPIQENWETIRDEALSVYEQQYFDKTTDKDNAAHYDIGFQSFYKYGWSKFYITWYGYTHASARRLCPRTAEILERVPGVNGAMLTILPPGGKLTRHLDPLACSLRYHLGLKTPNDDRCYINVDGRPHAWRDGEAILFDETFIHFVENETDQPRLILMCDVERPLRFPGNLVNLAYKGFARLSIVPNTDEDKRGPVNRAFASIAPLRAKAKALKKRNKPLFRVIQYTSILASVALGVGILVGGFALLGMAFQ